MLRNTKKYSFLIFSIGKKALSDDQIAQFKIRRPKAFQYFNDENGTVNQLALAENDWSGCHPRNGFQISLFSIPCSDSGH